MKLEEIAKPEELKEQEKQTREAQESFTGLVGQQIVSCFPYALQQLIYNKLTNIRRAKEQISFIGGVSEHLKWDYDFYWSLSFCKEKSENEDKVGSLWCMIKRELGVLKDLKLSDKEKQALVFAAAQNFYVKSTDYLMKEDHKISLKYEVYRKKYYALLLAYAQLYEDDKAPTYTRESLLGFITQHLFKEVLSSWHPKKDLNIPVDFFAFYPRIQAHAERNAYLRENKKLRKIFSLSKNLIPKNIFNSSRAARGNEEKEFFKNLNLSNIQKENLLEECKFQIKLFDYYHSPKNNFYHWENLSPSMHDVIRQGAMELIILCEEGAKKGEEE